MYFLKRAVQLFQGFLPIMALPHLTSVCPPCQVQSTLCLSVSLSILPSLSIYPSIYLSIYLSISLSLLDLVFALSLMFLDLFILPFWGGHLLCFDFAHFLLLFSIFILPFFIAFILSFFRFLSLSLCLFISLSPCLSPLRLLSLCPYQSINQSINQSIYIFIDISLYLSFSAPLSVHPFRTHLHLQSIAHFDHCGHSKREACDLVSPFTRLALC